MGMDELKLIMDTVSSVSGMGVNVAYAYFVQALPFAFWSNTFSFGNW